VDLPNAACPFNIRVTAAAEELVVAPGQLTQQTWAGHDRRTFHFSLAAATPACLVALAIGILD
jgi:aminopeptidase N